MSHMGGGQCFARNINLIKYYVEDILDIQGVTDNNPVYRKADNYEYLKNIKPADYDIVLIMADGETEKEIETEALRLGFQFSDIVPYKAVYLWGFSFEKYVKLRANIPTILSPSCWGGITYNSLGLPFRSPLINMFIKHDEYLRMINRLPDYMEYELVFDGWGWEDVLKRRYPIMKCGDVRLFCNHYTTEGDVIDAWERRRRRINWGNIFVMDFEEDDLLMQHIADISYKKVCFTTFHRKNDWALYCDWNSIQAYTRGEQFGLFLNDIFCGFSGVMVGENHPQPQYLC